MAKASHCRKGLRGAVATVSRVLALGPLRLGQHRCCVLASEPGC